ncbi:MAG: DUF2569 domain-containing protein [Enterobacteriaceae bacterium]|nr:DUF2569 domain-containing protein [Enterobacteriaceae bacterium]
MTETSFKWTCLTCDKDIAQHLEYCAECEEKRYRKIGGLLFLPLLNILLMAYDYFTSLIVTLKLGTNMLGRIPVYQTSYLFTAAGINLILLLLVIYVTSLFVRKKRALPLAFSVLLVASIAIMMIDRAITSYLFAPLALNFDMIMPIVRYIIFACIWIPYFRFSVRVKKTFVW